MGAWFEAIVKRVIPNSRVTEEPISSQLKPTSQLNVGSSDCCQDDVEVDVNKNMKVISEDRVNGGDHLSGDNRLTEHSEETETKESSCDDAHLYFVQFEGLVTLQQLL